MKTILNTNPKAQSQLFRLGLLSPALVLLCILFALIPALDSFRTISLFIWSILFFDLSVFQSHNRLIRRAFAWSVFFCIPWILGLIWLVFYTPLALGISLSYCFLVSTALIWLVFVPTIQIRNPWLSGAYLIGVWMIGWHGLSLGPFTQLPIWLIAPWPNFFLAGLSFVPASLLTAIWMLFSLFLAQAILARTQSNFIKPVILLFIFLILNTAAAAHIHFFIAPKRLSVALIQHNLSYENRNPLLLSEYRSLAYEARKTNPQLIIFPLYTLPSHLISDAVKPDGFFSNLAHHVKTPILLATHISQDKRFAAEAYFFEIDGKILSHRAVIAAPFESKLQVVADQFAILETSVGKIGVLLCYEDTIQKVAQLAKEKGADFLVALSNPGLFKSTALPLYALRQTQMRALETRLPVLRVSANGFSAAIQPSGKIIKKSNLNRPEIIHATF